MASAVELTTVPNWFQINRQREKRLAFIKRLCSRIADAFHPQRIILFGSQTTGNATADSDVDLLVIMTYEGRHTTAAIRILQHLNVLAPIDLLVRSPKEIEERLALGDRFIAEIIGQGQVMYEAADAGMD